MFLFVLSIIYLVNHYTHFNETQRYSLDVHLQLPNFWSQHSSQWLPQLINFSQHKKGIHFVRFNDTELKFDVIKATIHLQDMLEVQTHLVRSHNIVQVCL